MLYHFGCGERRLEGYVNVDVHETPAVDLVTDLNEPALPRGEVNGVFSNAFFEHLYRNRRVPHLRAVREGLDPRGFVCYLGLPDFRRVAELYLGGGRGVVGPVFDLWNVYRYSHGDPEMTASSGDPGAWLAQLHKSLFDVHEIDRLLDEAGYPSWTVFRYVFPEDPPGMDLSLGFYAEAVRRPPSELRSRCLGFLEQFDGRFVDLATVAFEHERSRPGAVARLASAGPRRGLRRAAYAAAARIARWSSPV